jgi:tripartite ATP-independent transporter DctP family solute receptor
LFNQGTPAQTFIFKEETMKRIMFVALLGAVVFTLAAAGTASAAAKWNIKFGHDQPEKSPHHDGALYFKKLVEEGSNGEIAIKIFPSQLLGTGLQMSEMVQAGALEILAIPTSNMQVLHPSLQVLDLPFLFPDREALFRVLDSDFTDNLYKPLLGRNIVGLHWIISGFKQFTGNFPIRTPDDFKGRKIRVMPAPIIREQFKALGASPVPIDFHELYSALQQGVVDGQENPLTTIVTMKFYEVQKYMTLSNHAFIAYVFVASKSFYDSLPEKYQKLVRESAKKAGIYERGLVVEREKGFLETIKKAGVTVIELKPEDRQAFQKAVEPVYGWFNGNIQDGKRYYDMVRAALKN